MAAVAPKNVRRLEDMLANVLTDEHDEDRGRPTKRHETEALRAALMAPALQQQPLGIREGQTVVEFPEARPFTGANAVARADGRIWDSIRDRTAMNDQPYTKAMQELARVQTIIARDPNKRFIDMYGTKTNQRPQALYDQDKLRILGAREAEMAAARRLDQQRKIVNAPAKEKQLEGLRAELARIEVRLALTEKQDPLLRVAASRAVYYLDTGVNEDPGSLEYLLQSAETALFVERMARKYQARLEQPVNKTEYGMVDMDTAVQMVRAFWEESLEAGTNHDMRSDAATRKPEDVKLERKVIDSTVRTENDTIKLLLAGYALNTCLAPEGDIEGRESYLRTAQRALGKALNWFYIGLTEFTAENNTENVRLLGDIYTTFKRLMGPFADWKNRLDIRDEPFDMDAAKAMVQLLLNATATIIEQLDEANVRNRDFKIEDENSTTAPVLLIPGFVHTEITTHSATYRSPTAFIRRLNESLERLSRVFITAIDDYEGVNGADKPPVTEFNMGLLRLILGDRQTGTADTFATWYTGKGTKQNKIKPTLSSILTTSGGAYLDTLADALVGFFERLDPQGNTAVTGTVRAQAAKQGYAHPLVLLDVQSVLKLSLSGLVTSMYDFVGPRGQKIIALDDATLAPFAFAQRNTDIALPFASLEWVLLTSFDMTSLQPLRLMMAVYGLDQAVVPQLDRLKRKLAELEEPLSKAPSESYGVVDVYQSFPALILVHLARAQINIVRKSVVADKATADTISSDIREGERILGEITAERHGRHGLLNPADGDSGMNERAAYQQPLAWAQLPEISGFILLSPNVTGQLDSARVSLGDHVPALHGIPLDVLTTQHDSGLAAWFCEYSAVMHARDELGHQTQFGRHEQYPENKRRLFEVIQHLKNYTYSRAGRNGPVTVYRRGTPYRQAALFADAGGVDTVGLF